MRVLLVTQYFTPEITAAPLRLHPLAAGLVERGHEVEVISALPNHPQGIVHPGYRGLRVRREMDGIRVTYVWTYVSPSKRATRRLANYTAFAVTATAIGALCARPDVVVASSPPLTVGLAGEALATRFRAPLVLDVRDLWPEVAKALGQVTDPRMLRVADRLERRLCRRAAAVTTVTRPFVEHYSRLTEPRKVHLVPNGTTRSWLSLATGEVAKSEFGLPDDRFVWTYAGNVGLSQGLDTAIEAARQLGDGFQLLILGDGTARKELIAKAVGIPEGQVVFRDAVQPEVAARCMRASDALLVSLCDDPALGRTIPVKLYDSGAVGRPVIVAAPGESRRLAGEGAGLAVPPQDAASLADAVRRLAADRELRARVAEQGVGFAAGHLREQQVEPFERVLEAAVESPQRIDR
jgi:putative colanic acid biosynthesis glycosyltransferase WcaI